MSTGKFLKKILNWAIILSTVFLLAYIGYRLYEAAIENATRRIRQGVSQGIIDTVNPLKWPGKIFGHRRKQADDND